MNSIRRYEVPLQKYMAMMDLEVPHLLAFIHFPFFRVDVGILWS